MLPSQVYRKPKACTKLRQGRGCSPQGFFHPRRVKRTRSTAARSADFPCSALPPLSVRRPRSAVFSGAECSRYVSRAETCCRTKKARVCGSRTRANVHKRHVWYNWRRVLGAPATPITSPTRGYKTGLVVQFAAFLCQWGLCGVVGLCKPWAGKAQRTKPLHRSALCLWVVCQGSAINGAARRP